ncbi:MAG: DUF4198 domain-containing protein [Terriglobia bacterium]
MKKIAGLILAGAGLAVALAAHDTWLVPATFRVVPGQAVRVALNTSEDFPTSEAAAAPDRIARFEVMTHTGREPVTGYQVEGQSLVAEVTPAAGLTLVAAVTKPRLIVLEPEVFNTYISEEGLQQIVGARATRGESYREGRERYSKIAKLVLCAEETSGGRSYREPMGLRVEIVPLTEPCGLRAGDVLTVQVLFEGRPLAGVWVGAGTEGSHGHRYPFWQKTDAEGRAIVPLSQRGPWFVRVLHMVAATEFEDAQWQSWFSTLTFDVE